MNNFFKKINPNIPKDRQSAILDPVLHRDENSRFYILTDSTEKYQPTFISKVLRSIYHDIVPFTLIYCYTFEPLEKDLKKDIGQFVHKYSTDYTKYIPKGSKVLAMGRSIYTLTKETYLTAQAFYSFKYTSTHFYHPPTKSWIFPVDDITKLYSFKENRIKDAFEYFFFKKQITILDHFEKPKMRLPELNFEVVQNPNEFLTKYIGQKMEVAWDLETSGLIYYVNKVVCITMSFDGRKGYYLDFSKIDLDILNQFFVGKFQIGANLKFDCRFLRGRGVTNVRIDFDTLNAGHCLNETAPNSLGAHGWMYTYYGGHEIELHQYRKSHPKLKDFSQIPRSILAKYASYDSVVCFQAYKKQKELLAEDSLLNKYYFTEVIPNLNLFLEIEMDGVIIDWDYLLELQTIFDNKKKKLEFEIYSLLGFEVNLSSTKDLPKALELQAHLPDIGLRGKNGLYLTNEEAMKTWSKLGYKVADKLLQYNAMGTQINTFIGSQTKNSAYWQYRDKDKVHPSYSVMLAKSHRNKCRGPNLQQVPKKTKTAPMFRKIFIPPEEDLSYIYTNDFITLELEDESILELSPKSICLVMRDNKEIEIEAKDLLENDDFLKVI